MKAMVTSDMVRVSGMEKPPTMKSVTQHASWPQTMRGRRPMTVSRGQDRMLATNMDALLIMLRRKEKVASKPASW